MTGTVKALEWEERIGVTGTFDAETGIGRYIASTNDDGDAFWFVLGLSRTNYVDGDIEAAKSAAQDDYERRILSGFDATLIEEIERLREYAFEATKAITGLTIGGSEFFSGRIGDMFTADLPFCTAHIRERIGHRLDARRALTASASEPEPVADEARLYDADQNMADGEIRMTAAEDVLGWLLIEKIGVPDDCNYTPNQAQEIIASRLDALAAFEDAALAKPVPTPDGAVADAMVDRAIATFLDDPEWTVGLGVEEKRKRMRAALSAALSHPATTGLRMPTDPEWYVQKADLEGDLEVGAGFSLTGTINPSSEERAELERLAMEALPEWARKEIETLRALSHPADGWRPIKSAPKDGTRILSVKYFGRNLYEAAIVRWSETDEEWWDDDADQYVNPDLWMPLPAAPLPEGRG